MASALHPAWPWTSARPSSPSARVRDCRLSSWAGLEKGAEAYGITPEWMSREIKKGHIAGATHDATDGQWSSVGSVGRPKDHQGGSNTAWGNGGLARWHDPHRTVGPRREGSAGADLFRHRHSPWATILSLIACPPVGVQAPHQRLAPPAPGPHTSVCEQLVNFTRFTE